MGLPISLERQKLHALLLFSPARGFVHDAEAQLSVFNKEKKSTSTCIGTRA